MLKDVTLNLLHYTRWANQRLFSMVTDEWADAPVPSSFPGIRPTFFHLWDAELIWYQRLTGDFSNVWPPAKVVTGTMADDLVELEKLENQFIALMMTKDESYFTQRMTYTNLQGREFSNEHFHVVQHVVNHSTFHRGQVVTQLRQLGATSIPSTDMIAYFREMGF